MFFPEKVASMYIYSSSDPITSAEADEIINNTNNLINKNILKFILEQSPDDRNIKNLVWFH